jgi:hypothetical protein
LNRLPSFCPQFFLIPVRRCAVRAPACVSLCCACMRVVLLCTVLVCVCCACVPACVCVYCCVVLVCV